MTQVTRTARPEADPSIILPTPERDELRAVVARFVARHGTHEAVRESIDSDSGYSESRWRRLNDELQVAALAVPEELGGHGFGFADLGVVLEETGAALLPEPLLVSAVIAGQALVRADDPASLDDLLGAVMEGRRTIGVSLDGEVTLSAGAGATGEAGSVVNGLVPGVLWGEAVDSLVVVASSGAEKALVVVDLTGAERRPREVVDLTRRRADVQLVDAPTRILVGAARFLDVVRELTLITGAALAAEHAGIAARLLDDTVAYVQQRHQFGRAIGSFQAIKHRLADMLVDRERARSAAMYALAVLDEDDARDAELAVAVASAVCADAATRSAYEAIQLHGGIGFTWEHSAHFYLRRALGDEGAFGGGRKARRSIADLVGV
ncbi:MULTISPECIES: acyl-CoA dehydrogenase family protein [unclassified Dietzia]|uniref:acyl-CoA dehydrogenase family protein n=1 Tax=unclassified Dietzia TaxID=2617939 RepID=UPI0013166F5A|nr:MULTISPECIES: acyl-CoA dehydrogenase family protein [unclassified Dietzia]QGW25176.1 acyl-CoA dehydrogenase [Dietzia sp. DQ12-45-1b]